MSRHKKPPTKFVTTRAEWLWDAEKQEYVLQKKEGYWYDGPWALAHDVAPTWGSDHFRWRNDDGSESAATWIKAEDTNPVKADGIAPGDNVRLRVNFYESAGAAGTGEHTGGWTLQFNKNSGGWTTVGAATDVKYFDSSNLTNGTDVGAQRLTDVAGVTFATTNGDECEDGVSKSVGPWSKDEGEAEFSIQFDATNTAEDDSIDFRLIAPDGTTAVTIGPSGTNIVLAAAGAASQIAGISAPTFGADPDFDGMLGQVSAFRFIGASATLTSVEGGTSAIEGVSALTFANGSDVDAVGVLAGASALSFANQSDIDAIGVLAGASALSFSNQSQAISVGELAGASALSFNVGSDIDATGVLAGISLPTFANPSTVWATALIDGVSTVTFSNQSDIDGTGIISGTSAVTFANPSTLISVGVLTGASTITFSDQSGAYATGVLAGVSAPTFANQSDIDGTGVLAGVSLPTFANASTIGSVGASELAGVSSLTFANGSAITATGVLAGISTPTFGADPDYDGILGSSFFRFIGSSATLTAAPSTGSIAGVSALSFANQSAITNAGTNDIAGVSAFAFSNENDIDAEAYIVEDIAITFSNASTISNAGASQIAGVSSASFSNQSAIGANALITGSADASFANGSAVGATAQISAQSAAVFSLTATPLGEEVAAKYPAHAGRGKAKKRYVVEIDGQEFVLSSLREVRELMQSAQELAEKKAPVDLLVVSKRIRRKRVVPKVAIDDFPTPRFKTDDTALKELIKETQEAVNQIYLRAARDAEMRELLRRKMREEDEEEAISLLLIA